MLSTWPNPRWISRVQRSVQSGLCRGYLSWIRRRQTPVMKSRFVCIFWHSFMSDLYFNPSQELYICIGLAFGILVHIYTLESINDSSFRLWAIMELWRFHFPWSVHYNPLDTSVGRVISRWIYIFRSYTFYTSSNPIHYIIGHLFSGKRIKTGKNDLQALLKVEYSPAWSRGGRSSFRQVDTGR